MTQRDFEYRNSHTMCPQLDDVRPAKTAGLRAFISG